MPRTLREGYLDQQEIHNSAMTARRGWKSASDRFGDVQIKGEEMLAGRRGGVRRARYPDRTPARPQPPRGRVPQSKCGLDHQRFGLGPHRLAPVQHAINGGKRHPAACANSFGPVRLASAAPDVFASIP